MIENNFKIKYIRLLKSLVIVIFSILPSLVFAQVDSRNFIVEEKPIKLNAPGNNISESDIPNKIGPFMINQSTVRDLIAMTKKGDLYDFSIIGPQTFADCLEKERDPYANYFTSADLYKITGDDNDSTENTAEFSSMDSTQCFFINQYQIEDHIINNIYLKYFHDTLIKFQYSSGSALLTVLSEKYRGKGNLLKSENLKNLCSPKIKTFYKIFGFYNETSPLTALLSIVLIYSSRCDDESYVSLISYDSQKLERQRLIVKREVNRRLANLKQARDDKRTNTLNSF